MNLLKWWTCLRIGFQLAQSVFAIILLISSLAFYLKYSHFNDSVVALIRFCFVLQAIWDVLDIFYEVYRARNLKRKMRASSLVHHIFTVIFYATGALLFPFIHISNIHIGLLAITNQPYSACRGYLFYGHLLAKSRNWEVRVYRVLLRLLIFYRIPLALFICIYFVVEQHGYFLLWLMGGMLLLVLDIVWLHLTWKKYSLLQSP